MFHVHLNKNQLLKYVNADSTHIRSRFKSISTGVYKYLAKFISLDKDNKNTKISDFYPKDTNTLDIAILGVPITIFEQQQEMNETVKVNTRK